MVSQSCYRCRKKVSALTKKGLQEKIDKEFIICSDVISYLCSSCKKEVDKENEINVMIKRLQELGTPHNINELKVIIDFTVNTLKVSKFLYIVYFDLINNIKDDLFEYVVFLLKEEVLLNIQNLNK